MRRCRRRIVHEPVWVSRRGSTSGASSIAATLGMAGLSIFIDKDLRQPQASTAVGIYEVRAEGGRAGPSEGRTRRASARGARAARKDPWGGPPAQQGESGRPPPAAGMGALAVGPGSGTELAWPR